MHLDYLYRTHLRTNHCQSAAAVGTAVERGLCAIRPRGLSNNTIMIAIFYNVCMHLDYLHGAHLYRTNHCQSAAAVGSAVERGHRTVRPRGLSNNTITFAIYMHTSRALEL